MSAPRVIGTEHIKDARRRGRRKVEVLAGDIITELARETAARLKVEIVDEPQRKQAAPRTDGNTALHRGLFRRSAKWVAPSRTKSRTQARFGKLALVGAGGVGGNIAHLAAMADMAHEIALIDIAPGLAESTALDINHASGITRTRARCLGGEDMGLAAGADVIVVTAGRARTPGMSRADLVDVNRRIIHATAQAICTVAPGSVVIVVTNPLDEMTSEMLRATQFPRERVIGMAGTLDGSRFRNALALAAGVNVGDVNAIALGSHGDEMAPVASLARIKGQSLSRFLDDEQIDSCVRDAVTGGGQVVALRKSGSATIAPAHATIELMRHMLGLENGPVPVSVRVDGEYGLSGVVLGVPAHLGPSGLIKIEEIGLTQSERADLHTAAKAIRDRLETLQ